MQHCNTGIGRIAHVPSIFECLGALWAEGHRHARLLGSAGFGRDQARIGPVAKRRGRQIEDAGEHVCHEVEEQLGAEPFAVANTSELGTRRETRKNRLEGTGESSDAWEAVRPGPKPSYQIWQGSEMPSETERRNEIESESEIQKMRENENKIGAVCEGKAS